MSSGTQQSDIQRLESRMEKRFDELLVVTDRFAQNVDQRFQQVDCRFEGIDKRLGQMVQQFAGIEGRLGRIEHELVELRQRMVKIEKSYGHLLNTIDSFISRIDGYEIEMAARDRQMERLLDWARQVSLKTGIPLEDL